LVWQSTYRIEPIVDGYYWLAIGEDEDAAEAIGVNGDAHQTRHLYDQRIFSPALAGTFYVSIIYFIESQYRFPISTFRLKRAGFDRLAALERYGGRHRHRPLEATSPLLQSFWAVRSVECS